MTTTHALQMSFSRLRAVVFAVALCSCMTSYGQRSLEQLGAELVAAVTEENPNPTGLYITLEQYHKLIKNQPLSPTEISRFQQEVNDFHPQQQREFIEKARELQQIYFDEISRGAQIELDTILSEPVPGTRHIYEVRFRLKITYSKHPETLVYLDAMVGRVEDEYALIAPIAESYE